MAVLWHIEYCPDGVYVVESKLYITNYNYPIAKISCSGENEGNSDSLTAQLIGKIDHIEINAFSHHQTMLHAFNLVWPYKLHKAIILCQINFLFNGPNRILLFPPPPKVNLNFKCSRNAC